jgi:general secretion pathway protein K
MMRMPHRERGIALLIALLTVALAAVLIAGLLDRGELALARTRNAVRGEQAEAYAQALEAYAAEVLIKDLDDGDEDNHSDLWASPLPPQQVPGGTLLASLTDLNGCFNLNNLGPGDDGTWLTMFGRLLAAVGVDAEIASAVKDWIGPSDSADGYYLAQQQPYRTAQRAFAHVSELRLVRGVTGEVYARLAPYVCALPPGTRINVNTASVPVLQTLGNISKAQAESLWQGGQAHWTGQFWHDWQGIPVDMRVVSSSRVGTSSSYFLARGDIRLDDVPFTFFSLIERSRGAIRVVERSRGSDDALVAAAVGEAAKTGAGNR